MISNTRKVHRLSVVFGVACAVAAALPCIAEDVVAPIDTVTVQAKPDSPAPAKKHVKAAAEENIGFVSGLAIGAVAGGPIGAIAGGITGALLGEHYHKQKMANHELANDLSGSKAEKEKLSHTVEELDGSLKQTQAEQVQLTASLDHARELTLNVAFRTGDAHLSAADIDQLTSLGKLAGGINGVKIQVSGHADPRGGKDYNTALSRDRAQSVAAVLTNAGLKEDRLIVEALGADGDSSGDLDDYAFQRRVSVKMVPDSAVADATSHSDTVAQAQ